MCPGGVCEHMYSMQIVFKGVYSWVCTHGRVLMVCTHGRVLRVCVLMGVYSWVCTHGCVLWRVLMGVWVCTQPTLWHVAVER